MGIKQIIGADGSIQIVPLTPDEEAQALLDASNAATMQATLDAATARKATFLSDTDYQDLLNRLASATPAQIKNYVANNVTDLASAKMLMTKILLLISLIAR